MSSIKATNRDMVGGARQRSHTSSTTVPRGGQADEDLILASISAAAGFWSSAPDLIFYLVASLFLIPELFDLISSTASFFSSSSPLLFPPLLLGSYKRHNCGGIADLLKCLVLLSGGVSMSKSVAREDGGSQLHVLAVDDSSLDRKLIERLLKSSAYRVTTVDSGKRALELLGVGSKSSNKKPKVNMIITDYCMPDMTGFDLLKKVKESSNLKEIPVVVVSSDNIPTRINRCLEEGAVDFLLKPLRPSDVSRLHARMSC